MKISLNKEIEVWEGEGGAASGPPLPGAASIGSTAGQMGWAERIKRRVNTGFNLVAASVRPIAARQKDHQRTGTSDQERLAGTTTAILTDHRTSER